MFPKCIVGEFQMIENFNVSVLSALIFNTSSVSFFFIIIGTQRIYKQKL